MKRNAGNIGKRILLVVTILLFVLGLGVVCVAAPKKVKQKTPCPISTQHIVSFSLNQEDAWKKGITGVYEDILGYPQGNVVAYNTSKKTIDAFEVQFALYDSFNRPVNKIGSKSNIFKGIAQKISLKKSDFEEYKWSLVNYPTATKLKNVQVVAVHFVDGSVWKK